jgi:hypothetical protein
MDMVNQLADQIDQITSFCSEAGDFFWIYMDFLSKLIELIEHILWIPFLIISVLPNIIFHVYEFTVNHSLSQFIRNSIKNLIYYLNFLFHSNVLYFSIFVVILTFIVFLYIYHKFKVKKMQQLISELESKSMNFTCAICQDRDCEILFLPCSHFCCCNTCLEQLKASNQNAAPFLSLTCPICRRKVDQEVKVFH